MDPKNVAQIIAGLRGIFARHEGFDALRQQFDILLQRTRAERELGLRTEARSLALIGAPGSGKTTATDKLILDHNKSRAAEGGPPLEIVSFRAPSPATLKFVGYTALEALGFPLQRDKTTQMIWGMVRAHLRENRTLFLHIDEAQDLAQNQTPKEMMSVLNTIKSLMQAGDWPVGVILTGLPDVRDMLNFDPQLARRFYPLEMRSLHGEAAQWQSIAILKSYLERANLKPDDGLCGAQFAARLLHASDREFGLMIELILGAIEEALLIDAPVVEAGHFTSAFRRKSGCINALNPFVVEDFGRINARKLLGNLGE